MNPDTSEPDSEPARVIPAAWVIAVEILRAVLRWLYTLAVVGGFTYLIFWRGESGWLYLLAAVLVFLRRGL